MPREFARQPRSLAELYKWKATEFRQFVLYTGPIVLKPVVSNKLYYHFLTLTVAMSIYLDLIKETRSPYCNYAKELMLYFVKTSTDVYGNPFVTYNFHNLIHLGNGVENFQTSLNDISAFRFENYFHKMKKKVRNAQNPIAQLIKRIHEIEKSGTSSTTKQRSFFVSTKKKAGCYLLANYSYAFGKERYPGRKYVCDVVKKQYLESLFLQPCDSKLINIVLAKDMRRHKTQITLDHKDFKRKVICLPYQGGHVLMPMLHGIEKRK
ncbi:unnamed protein product [Mytilus coruscus]|uniref:Uncharacterized protein n=1 Tax=Mytilus coruscus TaxID=42192 RepID=A0A6J7ZUN8_MYTCO|nr:unnamed protein product [Mytilus coruscus]